MRWRPTPFTAIAVPMVALLAAVQFFIVQPASSAAAAAPTRIMALGDSITAAA
jgi:hypothetical protein